AFKDEPARDEAASFGDAGQFAFAATRAFAGDEAEKSHQLAGIVETPHVADFGDDPCRNRKPDGAPCLEPLNDGTKRPFRHERLDLLLDEILAFECLIHGIEVSLEGDLLCGMGEALIGKPDTVLLFPDRTG